MLMLYVRGFLFISRGIIYGHKMRASSCIRKVIMGLWMISVMALVNAAGPLAFIKYFVNK